MGACMLIWWFHDGIVNDGMGESNVILSVNSRIKLKVSDDWKSIQYGGASKLLYQTILLLEIRISGSKNITANQ